MILLDTNVLIYALNVHSPLHAWASNLIADAMLEGGVFVNAISLAELCVGAADPNVVVSDVSEWGVKILDIPALVALPCASAYRVYRERRKQDSGKLAPEVPLPDFFIGAHALVMGWAIATADRSRFATYFPEVKLIVPDDGQNP